jgi:hypothetical protein
MDAVLYRKYGGSPYVEPREEEKTAFKNLPDRFPSVFSRDFRREQGQYEDEDNLFAMYLLYNLARYAVRIDATERLQLAVIKTPLAYAEAARSAAEAARSDSLDYSAHAPFAARGRRIGEDEPESGSGR